MVEKTQKEGCSCSELLLFDEMFRLAPAVDLTQMVLFPSLLLLVNCWSEVDSVLWQSWVCSACSSWLACCAEVGALVTVTSASRAHWSSVGR